MITVRDIVHGLVHGRRRARPPGSAVIGIGFAAGARTAFANGGPRERIRIGDWVTLQDDELRLYGGCIVIGDCVWMSVRGPIVSARRMEIGDHSIFGRGVYISDTNKHPNNPAARWIHTDALRKFRMLPDRTQVGSAPVRIGRNVRVGERAIALKGVTVGEGAIVAAGAVVTLNVLSWTVVDGNPAHLINALRDTTADLNTTDTER